MYEFHRRAEAKGEALPAAITIGIHPIHYMGSMAYHYPPNVSKYEIIGALFGESYKVATCKTNDLSIPAGAGERGRGRGGDLDFHLRAGAS